MVSLTRSCKFMNNNYPLKLSIIVPVYNVEKYLERCIKSLLHQDLDKLEYEIVLVNDGSTDCSYEIAKGIKDQYDNVVLLSQDNKGLSVARNRGLEVARGKYIMFVDSDDFISFNIIGKLVSIADHNKLDLCFYRTAFEYGNGKYRVGPKQEFSDYIVYEGEYLVLNGMKISSVWQSLFSTKFLSYYGIKFCEGIFHQDVEFNYRLYPFAKRVMFTDILGYHYCVYGESTLRTQNPLKVRKIIESDFYVAKSLLKSHKSNVYSNKIKHHYSKVGNSIAVSALIQLWRSPYLNYHAKIDCLNIACQLGVYPIRGVTNSWKTTFLAYLLNCKLLLKYLFK